eukprot:768080-Hanusia_phi.AAC.3
MNAPMMAAMPISVEIRIALSPEAPPTLKQAQSFASPARASHLVSELLRKPAARTSALRAFVPSETAHIRPTPCRSRACLTFRGSRRAESLLANRRCSHSQRRSTRRASS